MEDIDTYMKNFNLRAGQTLEESNLRRVGRGARPNEDEGRVAQLGARRHDVLSDVSGASDDEDLALLRRH